ncbi:MAG: hypothetical protein R3C49_27895 [Planctomycetaceae bacterium]
MTIHILTIPDDTAHWPGWLEQQLVGLHLSELIDELQVMKSSADSERAPSASLSDLLPQQQLQQVCDQGLKRLDTDTVRMLLGNPECLLDLQELVLTNGGDHWKHVSRTAAHADAVDRIGRTLRQAIETEIGNDTSNVPLALLSPSVANRGQSRRSLIWALTSAAVVLLAVTIWSGRESGSGRVLGRPGLLTAQNSSSAEYFNRLADAGNDWFQQSRDTRPELVALLREVSADCDILIQADHKVLTTSEREWFVTKCRNWKRKFDETLASLETGDLSVDDARQRADATMTKLVSVLKAGPTA